MVGDVKVMETDTNHIIKLTERALKGNIHHCQACTINLRKEHCDILPKIFKFQIYPIGKFIFLKT